MRGKKVQSRQNAERRASSVKGRKHASRAAHQVSRLLDWFTTNARDLPWRRTLDPYAVWVSEIMLQQTQVKTVIPYFERWMRELPTIQSLAEASSEKIHKLWEGLGYYTRVRNMQKAARAIVEKHQGIFPREFDAVLALPGIGRYTAGAICSIAFNQSAPILDGNVIRVLSRVFGVRENAKEKTTNAKLWQLAEQLVKSSELASLLPPHGEGLALRRGRKRKVWESPGSFPVSGPCSALNQALMELGATICVPRQPRCNDCPLTRECVARKLGMTDVLPNLGKRVSATPRRFVACIVKRYGAVLVRQRSPEVVNGHLWEFPNVEVPLKASSYRQRKALETELGLALGSVVPFATVKHTITRYRITLDAVRGELNGSTPRATAGQWVAMNQLEKLPFTSAHRRVLGLFLKDAYEAAATS